MNEQTYRRRSAGSGINVVLGIWVIISPFVLGFSGNQTARWNDVAVGIAVAILALSGGSVWNALLGIWLIISPFVLGFVNMPTLLWNNIILGILIFIVAVSARPTRPVVTQNPPPP